MEHPPTRNCSDRHRIRKNTHPHITIHTDTESDGTPTHTQLFIQTEAAYRTQNQTEHLPTRNYSHTQLTGHRIRQNTYAHINIQTDRGSLPDTESHRTPSHT